MGEFLYFVSDLWTPEDKPKRRRRVVLIFAVAATVSTVLMLVAFTDVL